MGAVSRWDTMVAAWRVPTRLVAGMSEADRAAEVALCDGNTEAEAFAETPSRARAREALPAGGTLLDVGCGAGAASWPLADRAGLVVGVDPDPGMAAAYAARARGLGLAHAAVVGTWPGVTVPRADVVVCHHVLYYAAGVEAFVMALTERARGRVVVEIPVEYPHMWLRPLWRDLHGVDRPPGPVLPDALAVLAELGLHAQATVWDRAPGRWAERGDKMAERRDELAEHVRRRLYLPPDRSAQVHAALRDGLAPPDPRRIATVWWQGRA